MVDYAAKTAVLFDLDGTLTDPALGITNSVMYALEKFGILVGDRASLYRFIGPPLSESFEKYFSFSHAEAEKAVACYREYFADRGIFENKVYDGIPELLDALRHSGRRLILATSKPTVFAERILVHFGLRDFFERVCGSELDGTRVKKDEVIAFALEQAALSDKRAVVMIGDRKHDVLGAIRNGIDAVGVLYGYGSFDELDAAGAQDAVKSVCELKERFSSRK